LPWRRSPGWRRRSTFHGADLVTRRPLVIDVGAAGKGHLVDIVADMLRSAEIQRFLVDAGGDLRHHASMSRWNTCGTRIS